MALLNFSGEMSDECLSVEAYRLVYWRDIMKRKNEAIEKLKRKLYQAQSVKCVSLNSLSTDSLTSVSSNAKENSKLYEDML